MWLLNTTTLELKDFVGAKIPEYVILSHTWDEDEVSFRDMRKDQAGAKQKAGYAKVEGRCAQARKDRHSWIWIDLCCIDKRSSAELSEAINSMYIWYQRAQVCYAYLSDVPSIELGAFTGDNANGPFSKSRWHTRGWTLQELTAPKQILFFARDWSSLGYKNTHDKNATVDHSFVQRLADVTGIYINVLRYPPVELSDFSVAERMAWAASRETTREEDVAYSLMGLFDVHMPILYGEGQTKAFHRLQSVVLNQTPDHSILAWTSSRIEMGLLADSPADFASPYRFLFPFYGYLETFRQTNIGLEIKLPIRKVPEAEEGIFVARLNCGTRIVHRLGFVGIYLRRIPEEFYTGKVRKVFLRHKCNEVVKLRDIVKELQDTTWKETDVLLVAERHFKQISAN